MIIDDLKGSNAAMGNGAAFVEIMEREFGMIGDMELWHWWIVNTAEQVNSVRGKNGILISTPYYQKDIFQSLIP